MPIYVHTPRDIPRTAHLRRDVYGLRRCVSTVMFTSRWAWPVRWPIRPILVLGGSKFTQMGDVLPWTPMNRRAKFDAANFILGGENVTVQTNKQTKFNKQTVNDISTPCLSACVDNNRTNEDQWTSMNAANPTSRHNSQPVARLYLTYAVNVVTRAGKKTSFKKIGF